MANDTDTDTGAAGEAPRQTPPSAKKDATPRQGPSKLRRLVLPLALAGATGAAAYARRRSDGGNGDGLGERAKQIARGALEKLQEVGRVKEAATAVASKVADVVGSGPGSDAQDRAEESRNGGGGADGGDQPALKHRELPERDPRELEAARRERQARREERRKRAKT